MRTGKQAQQIRIIGGQWKRRKISFPALADIRPTADRVRETLFNWLSPVVEGAYCLDLFAGSGALGFEALSRGARHVVMVDKSPAIIAQLRKTALLLNTKQTTFYLGKVPHEIILPRETFDIVFLDPPFQRDLIEPSCAWLKEKNLIHPQSFIYIEMENHKPSLPLPMHFKIVKSGKTSQVAYYLTQLDNP